MAQGQIVIVGGGLVGQTLAHRLTRIGHDVTLVEQDEGTVRDLSETLGRSVGRGKWSHIAGAARSRD